MNINNFSKINANHFSGAKIYQKNQENLQALKDENQGAAKVKADSVEISFFQSEHARENYNSARSTLENINFAEDYLQSALV